MTRIPATAGGETGRLIDWMARTPAFRDYRLVDLAPLTGGGTSSDMLRVTAAIGGSEPEQFIVRRAPVGKQLFLEPDVALEYATIEGVHKAGTVPVPPLIALEMDTGVLGAPFFVMRNVDGFPVMGRPSLHLAGPLPAMTAAARRRISDAAMQALVDIHAIDWRRTHPFFVDDSGDSPVVRRARQFADWYAWAAKGRKFPVLDTAIAWLQSEAPQFDLEESVLLWGDARPGNILFRDDGSVSAVIDWETPLVGPAGIDVGQWMVMEAFQSESIGVERLPGWRSAPEMLAEYRARSGRNIDGIDYFVVMSAFGIAVTVMRQMDLGIAAGRFPADSRMGHENSLTQIVAGRLGLPDPGLSPDFIRYRGLDTLPRFKALVGEA